jgi:uncharacterized protein YbjT (DUF2867 family)
VTGATGMFGGGVTAQLAKRGVPVRAMTQSAYRAENMKSAGIEPVEADMDRPETLGPALANIDTVFMVSPMDERVQEREHNVLEAAQRASVRRIVKLYGAVQHRGDPLGRLHDVSVEAIKNSGLEWALLSPTSVLETSLLSMIPWIESVGAVVASAGLGRVAHVAADDVTRAAAVVLAERNEAGRNYVITGPELLTLGEVCSIMSRLTGRSIPYEDIPDQELEKILVEEAGMTPEQAEIGVICHYRAWRNGDAEACTETYEELTGEPPTTVEQWISQHREVFSGARDRAPTSQGA